MPQGTSPCAYAVVLGRSQRVSRVIDLLPSRDVTRGDNEQAASLGLDRVQVLESPARVSNTTMFGRGRRAPAALCAHSSGSRRLGAAAALLGRYPPPRSLHVNSTLASRSFQSRSRKRIDHLRRGRRHGLAVAAPYQSAPTHAITPGRGGTSSTP